MALRSSYPHADLVKVASGKSVFVFNVAENRFRLVAAVHFNTQTVFILGVMTHVEYDRLSWKDQL